MSLDAQQLRNLMDEVYRNADAVWPATRGEVTAERLIRFWLIRAQLDVGMLDGFPSSSPRWRECISDLTSMFGLAGLLQRVRDSYPVAAEFLAAELWSELDDGQAVHSLVWQWLDHRNLQPDPIRVVGERMAREQLPPTETAEPPVTGMLADVDASRTALGLTWTEMALGLWSERLELQRKLSALIGEES